MIDDEDYVGKTIFNVSQCDSLTFQYQDKVMNLSEVYTQMC